MIQKLCFENTTYPYYNFKKSVYINKFKRKYISLIKK